jgi:hypothetical protein
MRLAGIIAVVAFRLCAPVPAAADEQSGPEVSASGDVITARHRYVMGDNDTRSDARAVCFLEAKRKATEYAGTYVESTTELTQTATMRDARSALRTIAASLVSAELVSSKTGMANDAMFVECVVNARVDRSNLKENIARIAADPAVFRQVEERQEKLRSLEADVMKLQAQMRTASRQDAITLRQERAVVFSEIDALQKKKMEIVSVIEKSGQDAMRLIVRRMTREEVKSLLGEPRAVQDGNFNYGTQWVIFDKSSLVVCVSNRQIHHLNCR